MKLAATGNLGESGMFVKRAVDVSAKARVWFQQSSSNDGAGTVVTENDLDAFDISALCMILKTWDPADATIYGTCFIIFHTYFCFTTDTVRMTKLVLFSF